MAKIERPAADDRMAVLETSELPGSESMSDWALVLGSWVGTFDEARAVVSEVRAGRAVRWAKAVEGRVRAAPAKSDETFVSKTASSHSN